MRNLGSCPRGCWYQCTLLCPEMGWHFRTASAPWPLMRCLGDWVTPAAIDSVGEGDGAETSPGSRWTLPQQLKKLCWRDIPPDLRLTCTQETQGHTTEYLGAPGGFRQHMTGHVPAQGSGALGERAEVCPSFCSVEGLACDVTIMLFLSCLLYTSDAADDWLVV